GGRPSQTAYEVLEHGRGYTLVRCVPKTGRQHQIRVHLAALGHPILGDHLYGKAAPVKAGDLDPDTENPDLVVLKRQALHAASLSFTHPVTGSPIWLEAPLARDLAAVLR